MKPLIGVSSGIRDECVLSLHQINYEKISEYGGLPVVLPNLSGEDEVKVLAEKLDGLLLTGGGDIDPLLFNEEPHKELGEVTPRRDFFEIALAKEILKLNKPIFGICRGSQILNVASGGTLYQDIYSQKDGELLQHLQKAPREHAAHFVQVEEETMLFDIVKSNKIKVNTFHHQAVKGVGEGIKVSSRASDSVIESIESVEHKFALGVQWHPEYLKDEASQELFKAFIAACLE